MHDFVEENKARVAEEKNRVDEFCTSFQQLSEQVVSVHKKLAQQRGAKNKVYSLWQLLVAVVAVGSVVLVAVVAVCSPWLVVVVVSDLWLVAVVVVCGYI